MLQCKYTYSEDTLLSGKSCKSLLLSQTIYLMIELMMEDVMVNIALSTNGGKGCSLIVISSCNFRILGNADFGCKVVP